MKKYIEELKEELKNLKVVGDDHGVLDMAKRYLSDAEYFLEKGDDKRAAEAVGICWGYLDALVRLGIIKVKNKELFTL